MKNDPTLPQREPHRREAETSIEKYLEKPPKWVPVLFLILSFACCGILVATIMVGRRLFSPNSVLDWVLFFGGVIVAIYIFVRLWTLVPRKIRPSLIYSKPWKSCGPLHST